MHLDGNTAYQLIKILKIQDGLRKEDQMSSFTNFRNPYCMMNDDIVLSIQV